MKAIDIHVHLYTAERAIQRRQALGDAVKFFKADQLAGLNPDETAEYYRKRDMMAVVFDVDAETSTGIKISNDEVAAACQRNPDVFIGFGSVDPWKGVVAIREAERCVKELGLKGMKFMQGTMGFFPDDRQFYPLWAAIEKLEVPVIFHMGTTAIGNGAPGGRGIKLKYMRPIPHVDDVAADFPGMQIIAAHPGWPWEDELLAMVRHKGNVWMDLSGWAPKYFPASVIQYANTLIQDKVLFGTDFPLLSVDRWLDEFAQLSIKPEVRPKIMLENAKRLLKLA